METLKLCSTLFMRENRLTSAAYGIMINVPLTVDDEDDECVVIVLSMRIKILIFLRNSVKLYKKIREREREKLISGKERERV